jgi:hypothetical protein
MALIPYYHRFFGTPKMAHIPCYRRFSQTDLFGFIFPTIVDNRFINRFANDSKKNETNTYGLGKRVVIWDQCDLWGPKKPWVSGDQYIYN